MSERATATSLLTAARAIYDRGPLAVASNGVWRGGFASGGEWMRRSLESIRGQAVPSSSIALHRLGLIKYGLAAGAAVLWIVGCVAAGYPWCSLAAAIVFYAVEAQMVFLFPLSLDGAPKPFRACRRLTKAAGGTAAVMRVVIPLAVTMVFGGFIGRGFVRSWCLGCLAVCVWYERARSASATKQTNLAFCRSSLRVREEAVAGWGLDQPVRLFYASDLHLNWPWSRVVAREVLMAARRCRPDAILLGGDMVDRRRGLRSLPRLVRLLCRVAPVYAVPGNHDVLVGRTAVRRAVEEGGGVWLDSTAAIGSITLAGKPSAEFVRPGAAVLCAHHPSVFKAAERAGFNLVLAGHLHGGQCVLGKVRGRYIPGLILSRWTGPRFVHGRCVMLVSNGVGDILPMRWNCQREVIMCLIS